MKKTLLLTHEYYPFRGGIATYCYQLFRQFPSSQYVVVSDQRESSQKAPFMRRTLVSPFMKPSWIRGIYTIRKIVKSQQIECIVTPHILPLGSIAYALYRSMKVPYVISLHGYDIQQALAKRKALTIQILSHALHCITNSEATKRIVDRLKLKVPTSVITPYVDTEKLAVDESTRATLRKKYGTKRLIITVGRLVKRKGQDMLIQAMPHILRADPDVRYCIIGSGPDQAYLERCRSEARVEHAVDIITRVSDRELSAYYAQASVFAMPSRAIGSDIEGFGIVYLEAASFGLPIIAGNSGGEAEAVGSPDCGLIVDGNNAEEITESIVHLLHDRELAQFLGNNARARFLGLPTWKEKARELEIILS